MTDDDERRQVKPRPNKRHLLPLGVLLLFAVCEVALGRGQIVLALVVMSPLTAATLLGRRATASYAVIALVTATLLGVYEQQYGSATIAAQLLRLFGVLLGSVLAVGTVTLRLRREEALTRLTDEAASARNAVELAATLQRTLLTDPPAVPGLQIAVRYLPAVRNAQVGGDWYDAFRLSSGCTMLVIGDVAGHDVAAAATMAQTRGVLRGIAVSSVRSPAAVLSTLDSALAQLDIATLITAAVATLHVDVDAARLQWSNAGHPPPALLHADGSVDLLERRPERLLGAGVPATRSDTEILLGRGDTVLLYTDGVVERRGASLDQGMEWLQEQLRTLAGQPLDQLLDGLLAGMADQVQDDVAVLAVRFTG